ncbi:MAG: imidazole glycerol phosphate synthase subunit HisH [Bacteroidetes bacterium]|nr:imidazole glycerol phosphate synthase subunit HisH [Bacteroidota bacterium]
MDIAIIDYPGGNIRSVDNALKRLGFHARLTADPAVLTSADKVLFPGVGAAGATMKHLRSTGLDKVICGLKQPVLGICVGMQVLCSWSEEDSVECLGVFPQQVQRFPDREGLKVPHMGWNQVGGKYGGEGAFAYYVHSYYAPFGEYTVASSVYGDRFSAVLEKDNFLACQFHPEKSGAWGASFLKKFLES